MSDRLRFVALIVAYVASLAGKSIVRAVQAAVHRWQYKGPSDDPRTVVVVGGSFAGVQVCKRLADMLPTGWQVVLVEKNSHLNYSFNLPRFSVVPGYEETAFLPYDGIFRKTLPGIVRHVQGNVAAADVDAKTLTLDAGTTLPYDVLVVATGSAQRPPAKLLAAADRDRACDELRTLQERIRSAGTVAIVGGGAVGVEVAADVRTFAGSTGKPKNVTLVHSRPQLLNRFGVRLHAHVQALLAGKLGVDVVLGQRPRVVYDGDDAVDDGSAGRPGRLVYADGREAAYDCILQCTGQTPNSALLKASRPTALAPSGEIRVAPTLQVVDDAGPVPGVFALGDVAATGGAKMARAGFFQADTVACNVLAAVRAKTATTRYKPGVVEGSVKLTLGRDDSVVYLDEASGQSILLPGKGEETDAMAHHAWRFYGVPYPGDSK